MKFLVITASSAYETDVKHILKKCKVQTFSFHEIAGYKTHEAAEEIPHWFAGDESHTTQSVMFYVFASAEMADCVFQEVNHANSKQEFQSKIHLVSLNVEQSNIQ
jgi:nitrogen regulatory protein PII